MGSQGDQKDKRIYNSRTPRTNNVNNNAPKTSGGGGGGRGKRTKKSIGGGGGGSFGGDMDPSSPYAYGVAAGYGNEKMMEEGDEDDDYYTDENRPSRIRSDDNDDDDEAAIPDGLKHILFEYISTDNKIGANLEVSSTDFDEIDHFLATAYMESRKTSTGSFSALYVAPQFKHIQLPESRTLAEILQTTVPVIPENVSHAYAKELGERTWDICSKNIYMSEGQKRYVSQSIAKKTQSYLDFTDKLNEKENELLALGPNAPKKKFLDLPKGNDKKGQKKKLSKDEVWFMMSQDLVFQKEFRKGLRYIDEQKRREASKAYVPSNTYDQAETDWNVDAVVDEDDLFNSSSSDSDSTTSDSVLKDSDKK